MDKIKLAAILFAAALLAGAIWRFGALKADLSVAQAENARLAAANQSHQIAIAALRDDKAISEKALLAEAKERAALEKTLVLIRKDIKNAKTDPACMAADDRDRALAWGVRELFGNAAH